MRFSMDAGKHSGKGVCMNKIGVRERFYLRNKIEEVTEDNLTVDEEGYKVEYEGKVYYVGKEASKIDYNVTKTSIAHKLLIYIGITHFIGNEDEVDLMVGCPMSTYVNKEKKDKFIEYLKGDVHIKVKDKDYRFTIKSVNVLPESLGIPYKDTHTYKKRLMGVLDIGGLNVNGAIYDRLKPIKSSAFTINAGSLILQGKVKKALNNKLDLNFQDYEIPYIIESGVFINGVSNAEANAIVKEVSREHINTILDECRKYNWNIGGIDIEFTGGGSLDLKQYIEEYLSYAKVSGNGGWDNVTAFDAVGELLKIG